MITGIDGMYPILATKDIFNLMKAKNQNEVRYFTHFNILYNALLEMFEWHDLPPTIPKRFLESFLHSTGKVFIAKINGEIYACNGTLSGEVDAYGMGTECIAVTPVGETCGKRGVDIAYGINNDTSTPDTLTYWISHLLGETDKSLQANVLYSRYMPIPKVNDMKDKQAFDEVLDKLEEGQLRAFASRNLFSEELGENADVFEITDVNRSDKIQHLSRLYDDLYKRFYNVYGQPLQTQNKSSQALSDEVHGMDSVSFIIPMQMYKCRLALADEINRIFDTNISVTFSEPWLYEYNAFVYRDGGFVGENVPNLDSNEPYGGNVPSEGENGKEVARTGQNGGELKGTEPEQAGTEPEPDGTDKNRDGGINDNNGANDNNGQSDSSGQNGQIDDTVQDVMENGQTEITDKAGIEPKKVGDDNA